MSEKVPIYDNHLHMSPSGRNVDALKEYQAAGHTVIMSTHDAEDLDICDVLYLLKDGKISETDKNTRGAELLALLR